MYFIPRDQDHIARLDLVPLAIPENFPLAGMDKDLVLPCVGMLSRIPRRCNLKNPHAKVVCAVIFPNRNAAGDPFCFFTIIMGRRNFGILFNLHASLLISVWSRPARAFLAIQRHRLGPVVLYNILSYFAIS